MKGKSPFKSERTPSFFVDPEKNLFHCFATGKGGDIFTFIQEVEHVDFPGALKILADRAGVSLSKTNPSENKERSQLYEVMEFATKFYEVQFRKDPAPVQYLLERGLTKETMKDFRIGYAPMGWTHLYDALRAKGYSDKVIESAGLGVAGKKGGLYDRFRERIMFPIADSQGRIVAFTGRIFVKPDSDTDPKGTGKYVNSPETPIYHKSDVLFGYDRAKRAMMTDDVCIVVEGQMDLIMSHQAGLKNSVAISGTALTHEQVKLIQRFTDTLILALDADAAGIQATKRSVEIAYDHDMSVSVVTLSGGKDPADLVKEDPKKWQDAVASAQDYIHFRIGTLSKGLSTREKVTAARSDLFPFIARMKGSMLQDAALQKVTHYIGINHDATREDFISWHQEHAQNANPSEAGNVYSEKKRETVSSVSKTPQSAGQQLLGILIWQASLPKPLFKVEEYKQKVVAMFGKEDFDTLWEKGQKQKNRLIFEAQLRYDGISSEQIVRDITELLYRAQLKKLEKQQRNISKQLRDAEGRGDENASAQYAHEHQRITQQINDIIQAHLSS